MKLDLKKTLQDLWQKIKENWSKLTQKSKILVLSFGGGALALIVLATVLLNVSSGGYRVIFPGMSNEEAAQVYATLQEMNVQPQIDERGQVLVPKERWDQLVFDLNGKGFPKSTLSYDTFSNASGFTSTEFEKKTALIYQAQERAQQTLLRQNGVEDAVVTFSVPSTSNYIWDQTNQQVSSGNATIKMRSGHELTPELVTSVKHLLATSIPNLEPENVVVIDGATGIEMPGVDDASGAGYYSVQRLDYEAQIARRIEDNVKRLLAGRYGADGVTAVATVTLDYDKLLSETKTYQSSGGGNTGVISHLDEQYSVGGTVPVQGIVGEENNTDYPPIYPNDNGNGDGSITDYARNVDYDVSYIMTQIEKGEPVLQRATVAVIVDDPNFNIDVEETLIDLISKAVNISSDNIRVTNLNLGQVVATSAPTGFTTRQRLLLILGVVLLLVVAILVVAILLIRGRKKDEAVIDEEEEEELGNVPTQEDINKEIEEHKRMLQSEAMKNSGDTQKESAITEEIRNFAKENPEITASLLRTMLREEGN